MTFAKDSRTIFDLGMNNGEDTALYLASGFRVIAVEANPALCEAARARFRGAIEAGRLNIINAAIGDRAKASVEFFVNLDNDHWSSMDRKYAGRDGSRVRSILIPSITIFDLTGVFGTPYYLKCDIEGAEQCVLEQLQHERHRPLYLSVEDSRFGPRYIEAMSFCGYNGFKLVNQARLPPGSSGPFGASLPGRWLALDEMMTLYHSVVRSEEGGRIADRSNWFDIHCTKTE